MCELCTFSQIWSHIIHAAELSFSRQCVNVLPTPDVTLHVFADASPKAYGAVAYFQQGKTSSLAMSKSRAAPCKPYRCLNSS